MNEKNSIETGNNMKHSNDLQDLYQIKNLLYLYDYQEKSSCNYKID